MVTSAAIDDVLRFRTAAHFIGDEGTAPDDTGDARGSVGVAVDDTASSTSIISSGSSFSVLILVANIAAAEDADNAELGGEDELIVEHELAAATGTAETAAAVVPAADAAPVEATGPA